MAVRLCVQDRGDASRPDLLNCDLSYRHWDLLTPAASHLAAALLNTTHTGVCTFSPSWMRLEASVCAEATREPLSHCALGFVPHAIPPSPSFPSFPPSMLSLPLSLSGAPTGLSPPHSATEAPLLDLPPTGRHPVKRDLHGGEYLHASMWLLLCCQNARCIPCH